MKTAYFTMDTPSVDIVNSEEFQNLINFYTVEYQRVNTKGNRSLYLAIIKNESLLFSQENVPSIFEAFANFNPICIGVVDIDGVPMGLTYNPPQYQYSEGDEEGELVVEEHLSGEIAFPFNIGELMSILPPKLEYTYDNDGNILTTTEVPHTEPHLPIIPAGWKKPNWALIQKYINK
ncbi:MAG: hypothetical protein EOM19_05290 [Candidatus Moranbacteria bacterium]|nr:hypothetical protein [Candidatus Moranbacteria bacterium]